MTPPRCRTKGKRRTHKPTPAFVDQELAELAAVIAEYQLDDNAHGWFKLPWRDGWNAVGLALAVTPHSSTNEDNYISARAAERKTTPEMYWVAGDMIDSLGPSGSMSLRAALRCLQVLVANSDGGGHAYNAILIPAFTNSDPTIVAEHIMEHRCRDSIGTTMQFQGDANDRVRGAFRTAWSRGLYLAAYSLPPSINLTKSKLTVLKGQR